MFDKFCFEMFCSVLLMGCLHPQALKLSALSLYPELVWVSPRSIKGQLFFGAVDEYGHLKVSTYMYTRSLARQHGAEGRKRRTVSHRLGAGFSVLLVLNLNLPSGSF